MFFRKIFKVLSIFMLVLLLLAVIVMLTINLPVVRKHLVKVINRTLSQKEIPVHLGSLNTIRFRQINISDILIFGEEHDTIVFAGNLDVHFVPRTLLRSKITVLSIEIRELVLRLFQKDSEQALNLIAAFSNEQDIKDEPREDSTFWSFDIRKIYLTSVDLRYESIPQKMLANLSFKEADVHIRKIDLPGKKLSVPLIRLNEINSVWLTGDATTDKTDTTASFSFPWNIEITQISIQNSSFKPGKYAAPPSALILPEFSVFGFQSELSDIILGNDQLRVNIVKTAFNLSNGFELNDLHGQLNSRKSETVFDFHVLTNESEIHLNGNSDTFLTGIDGKNNKSGLSISDSRFALTDLLYFNPELKNAGWFKEYGTTPISIDAKVFHNGEITGIDSLFLYQSGDLWLSFSGSISNVLEPALNKEVDLKMSSSHGIIALDGNINLEKESIKATILMNHIRPGEISGQKVLHEFNGSVLADVNGFSTDRIYSEFKMDLFSVNMNDHTYDKIILNGKLSPQHVYISTDVTDTALNLGLKTTIERNKRRLSILTAGNFRIVPSQIGFGNDSMTVDGSISASFHQAGDSLSSDVRLSDISLHKPRDESHIGLFQLNMKSETSNTTITGNSDFMDLDFKMEEPVKNAGQLIKDLSGYFTALASNFTLDSLFQNFNIPVATLNAQLRYHPVLNLLTNDTSLRFSNASIHISSNEHKGTFYSNIQSDGIHVGDVSVGTIKTSMLDSAGQLNLAISADSITVSSQFIAGIEFSHQSDDSSHRGHTVLMLKKDKDRLNSEIEFNSHLEDSLFIVTIPTSRMMLNETVWQTSSPELFHYNRGSGEFLPEVTLSADSAVLKLVTVKESSDTGFDVRFDKVALSALVPAALLPDIAAALINGTVQYRAGGKNNLRIVTDLDLLGVAWSDIKIAQLGISGSYNSSGKDVFSIVADVYPDSAEMHLKGSSTSMEDRAFNVSFSDLSLDLIEPFLKDVVSELSGSVSGDVRLNTRVENEMLDGGINLNDVRVRIAALNSLFKIPNENIMLGGNKITFDRLTVLDSMDNELVVNGDIDFSDRNNVSSNVDISATKMLVMNSTQEDNKSFYGTILAGIQMAVNGPIKAPKVQGNLSVNKGTEIFYANQTSYKVQDMAKTVTFINSDAAPDLTEGVNKKQAVEQHTAIGAKVEVDPEAIIHFSLQDQLYDIRLDIHGGGTLNYNVFTNNQSNLSGIYEISEGKADLKIRGWSEKSFSIAAGSFIKWIDQMEDPEMQIEAQNSVTGKYKNPTDNRDRIVEFNVVLKVSNRLSALNVLLTVSTEDQYLMSIIKSMSPEEQMKQAVSLLLFQTVNIPGIYTTSNQINDQVNQIVESQLNKLTQASIKNMDISLGVNSYTTPTESGAEETKTSLSYGIKKDILNDRASIEVSGRLNNDSREGGNDYSANNFTFEYRLDSAATKYLQVYRQRSYEDILEGEVERTGFGIIFRKTFESIRAIWKGKKK